ncbi:substrate-binding domain-containing protein [Mangrovicoccus ximenensis]|uniref:substrate-binding domain-containing protein n=1 Tax=Mangrovicoccus ximenensis TaxID=1911570 RepID=UPI00191C23C8|nr:substrate-binding domain-containing protein [Mangrovicoccus ximenensis]
MPRQCLAAALISIICMLGVRPVLAADIFVVGGNTGHPFWSIVHRGAEDAGMVVEAQLGSVTWLQIEDYDDVGGNAAALIRKAIARRADGIVTGLWDPEPIEAAVQEAVAAGIPVILYNAGGLEAVRRLGALTYIGSRGYDNGRAAGSYFAANGLLRAVCVTTLPDLDNIAAMCRGLEDSISEAGGEAETLDLPPGSIEDLDAASDAVKQYLIGTPGVAAILSIGSYSTNASVRAVERAGQAGRVKIGSIDLDDTTIDRIRSGSQIFAIDQQGYLQGFLAVTILNAHVNFGLAVPMREILTGPGLIDYGNLDSAERGISRGAR